MSVHIKKNGSLIQSCPLMSEVYVHHFHFPLCILVFFLIRLLIVSWAPCSQSKSCCWPIKSPLGFLGSLGTCLRKEINTRVGPCWYSSLKHTKKVLIFSDVLLIRWAEECQAKEWKCKLHVYGLDIAITAMKPITKIELLPQGQSWWTTSASYSASLLFKLNNLH